jgi:DNA-directed RNA polymerase subunit L
MTEHSSVKKIAFTSKYANISPGYAEDSPVVNVSPSYAEDSPLVNVSPAYAEDSPVANVSPSYAEESPTNVSPSYAEVSPVANVSQPRNVSQPASSVPFVKQDWTYTTTDIHPSIKKTRNTVDDEALSFTLSGVDVSIANAIRRTILSDIETVIFRTSPNEKNLATIHSNTSRLNNEIVKQRLSCIPIHIDNYENMGLENYLVEVDVDNITDEIMYVTTENFRIKNITNNTYLGDEDRERIFPSFIAPSGDKYFIDFVRLRPKISDEIPGEKIHMTVPFSLGTAKEDSMYNVVGTCSYGFTIDQPTIDNQLALKQQQWRDANMEKKAFEDESKNWLLLEAKRFVIKNSFDFIIKSVGVFENEAIVNKACNIIIKKLELLIAQVQQKPTLLSYSKEIDNAIELTLENEDYTVGNMLNYLIYASFYEKNKLLQYCGFKKFHPHDTDSIIRVIFKDTPDDYDINKNLFRNIIVTCCEQGIRILREIRI